MVRGSLGLAQGHCHPPASQLGTLIWAGCSTTETHMSLDARAGVPMEGSKGPQGMPDVPPWFPPNLHPPRAPLHWDAIPSMAMSPCVPGTGATFRVCPSTQLGPTRHQMHSR